MSEATAARPDEGYLRELLRQAQHSDFSAREQLVRLNTPLVGSIVRRFSGSGRERDDLFQVGCIGLLKAIDRFDFTYNVCFSTYAVPLIMGEIRRFLRDDRPLSVSRTLQERCRLLENKRRELQRAWGREPELWQLAEECRLSPEEAVAALDAMRPPLSINDLRWGREHDELSLEQILPAPEPELSGDWLDGFLLREALEQLPPRLAAILHGRYFEDKPQRELALELGVSQVQISRLEKQALSQLRQLLAEHKAETSA